MKKLLFLRRLFVATMMCLPFAAVAQVTIGSVDPPETAALLDFKTQAPDPVTNVTTEQGGMLLPRVELTDRYSLEPFIDDLFVTLNDKRRHTGLTVFNVTENHTADLISGLYYWNGVIWMRMVTIPSPTTLNMASLATNVVTSLSPSATGPVAAMDDNGALMDFGTITAPEDGAYAFDFHFQGNITATTPTTTAVDRCIYYVKLFVNGVKMDSAEINMFPRVNGASTYTYSVTLAGAANAGDVFTFKINQYYADNVRPWTLLAGLTYLVWWKL